VSSTKALETDNRTPKKKSDDCIQFQRGGVLKTEVEDINMDAGSHLSIPDVDTTKEDRADMLAEFEEHAESNGTDDLHTMHRPPFMFAHRQWTLLHTW